MNELLFADAQVGLAGAADASPNPSMYGNIQIMDRAGEELAVPGQRRKRMRALIRSMCPSDTCLASA